MKAKTLRLICWIFAAAFAMLTLQACPEVEPEPDPEPDPAKTDPDRLAKDYLRTQYMDVYYYWRDEVKKHNDALDPAKYDIYDFFDEMLYKDDRWSWMCDKDYYVSDETGVVTGTWGISLAQAVEYYGDYGLRVRYVYPGSPLEQFGVTRGAVLTKLNDFSVAFDETGFGADKLNYFQQNYYTSPLKMTFRLADGRDTTFTATMAASLATRPGLMKKIFQPSDFEGLTRPVGYFHYLAFKANFLDDITDAMEYFYDNGVHDLIVDLRYNGGGDSRASDLLISYLAPKDADKKTYVVRNHSSYLASLDDSFSDEANTNKIERKAKSLDLDHIYFITGAGSASASEMVMNGLKPYMGDKQQMVGDTTYGKPNGMYVLMYPGTNQDYQAYNQGDYTNLKWVFLPICFFNQNSLGQNIPVDGFIPDNYRPDDLYHDFGVEESDIRACLTHLVTGSFPALDSKPVVKSLPVSHRNGGYRIELEEDKPNYGTYTVRRSDF